MGNSQVTPGPGDLVDPALAERMASEAGERPEVKRWVRRLGRLIKDMPPGLEVFVGEGVAVLTTGPNGEHFMTGTGGAEAHAVVDSFNDGRWDGGGW